MESSLKLKLSSWSDSPATLMTACLKKQLKLMKLKSYVNSKEISKSLKILNCTKTQKIHRLIILKKFCFKIFYQQAAIISHCHWVRYQAHPILLSFPVPCNLLLCPMRCQVHLAPIPQQHSTSLVPISKNFLAALRFYCHLF